jgi:3-oxoacyl-[acyl-carrier protein] reductase
VADAAHKHVGAHGPVHILINNTGGPPAGALIEASQDDLAKAFNQHVLANQALVQAVAPGMRDAKYGRIINIISTSVITPIKGLGVSNTIRGAVANWARTLAHELAPFGITVNNVLPGYTATNRLSALLQGRANRAGSTLSEVEEQIKATIPMRRFADPSEIAAVVAFLASPAASYVSGVNLPVDGARLAAQ